MGNEELLKLKRDVDELGMYYATIKNEIAKLEEIIYANNVVEEETHVDLTDDEIISKYNAKTRKVYWLTFGSIVLLDKLFGNAAFDVSKMLGIAFQIAQTSVIFSAAAWYIYRELKGCKNAPEKYRSQHPIKEEINLEEVKEKLETLYQREIIIGIKYNDFATKYQRKISELNDSDRLEYNKLVSEYMLELLNTAEDKLNSSILISEMDDEVFKENIVKGYELKQ